MKVPATCPDCGRKYQTTTENPAVIHKTKVCPPCLMEKLPRVRPKCLRTHLAIEGLLVFINEEIADDIVVILDETSPICYSGQLELQASVEGFEKLTADPEHLALVVGMVRREKLRLAAKNSCTVYPADYFTEHRN